LYYWTIVPYSRKELPKNAKCFQVFPNIPRKIPGKFIESFKKIP